jgi:hypothetical protein
MVLVDRALAFVRLDSRSGRPARLSLILQGGGRVHSGVLDRLLRIRRPQPRGRWCGERCLSAVEAKKASRRRHDRWRRRRRAAVWRHCHVRYGHRRTCHMSRRRAIAGRRRRTNASAIRCVTRRASHHLGHTLEHARRPASIAACGAGSLSIGCVRFCIEAAGSPPASGPR